MDLVYGVAVVYDDEDYNKSKMEIWSSYKPALLFNMGCKAIFILQTDAYSYGYEQSERRKIGFDGKVINKDTMK